MPNRNELMDGIERCIDQLNGLKWAEVELRAITMVTEAGVTAVPRESGTKQFEHTCSRTLTITVVYDPFETVHHRVSRWPLWSKLWKRLNDKLDEWANL
jgi:hypothetical protein